MADVAAGSFASWIQTGGVVAFAYAVLLQLRDLRPVLSELRAALVDVRVTVGALLERERARAERAAARRASASVPPPGTSESWEDEGTPINVPLPNWPTTQTPAAGVPIGAYAQHRRKSGER